MYNVFYRRLFVIVRCCLMFGVYKNYIFRTCVISTTAVALMVVLYRKTVHEPFHSARAGFQRLNPLLTLK